MIRDSGDHGAGGVPLLATRLSREEGDIFEVITKSDGSYAITLPKGQYTFRAGARGLSSELKRLEGSDLKLDWALDAGAEEERGAPPEVLSWIRSHAIPLRTVEAGNGFEDMQPLKNLVGDARIVALGEATHGTREFFQFKHRMFEFLATKMGFTVFGIEANWPESLAVDDYVVNGTGDPEKALAGMYFWTWNTEEVLEMIRWMRRYNENPDHPKKLHFYGFDMQYPAIAAERALIYIRRVDPDAASEAAGVLAPFRRRDAPISYVRRGLDYRKSITAGITQLLDRFRKKRRLYVARSSQAEWEDAEHYTHIVAQFEEMHRVSSVRGGRDQFMAENARWLLQQAGDNARMMIWAHNGHVTFSSENYSYKPMGAYLRQALGRDYLAIGFSFDRGSFQAKAMPKGLRTFSVGPAPELSLDSSLARVGIPLFAVDLRLLPPAGPVHDWWYRRHPARSIGAVYSDSGSEGYFIGQAPALNYDGLLFVESTTAARENPPLVH
jgi:erythromycin esterase